MGKKRPNQRERIVAYIKEKGSITRLESCTELFIFELSARITELEHRGWVFEKTWESVKNRYGEVKTFVRYAIISEGNSI